MRTRAGLFPSGRGTCLCVAGPLGGASVDQSAAPPPNGFGVATIRKCRVYRRGSSVFTRSFLLQNACELLRIDNAELQSPFLRHG